MGYGSRALKALNSFYSGEYLSLDEASKPEPQYPNPTDVDAVSQLFPIVVPSLTFFQGC